MSAKQKKIKFLSTPIIIGTRALELYKLYNCPENDPLHLFVCEQDFKMLAENNSVETANWYNYVAIGNIHYYLNWYNYTYENVIVETVRIKSKIVANKKILLMMCLLPAFDKSEKNKIPKVISKKNIEYVSLIINSMI